MDILGIPIHILLYADNIILVLESHTSLQHHLNALDGFYGQGFTVNLQKTEVMIFHTSAPINYHHPSKRPC